MSTDDPHPARSQPPADADGSDAATDPWAPAPDAPAPAPARPRRRGLLIAAIVLFAIGAVFTVLAAVTPFVIDRDAPTVLYVVAMICAPVGFLLGLLYAILGARPPRM